MDKILTIYTQQEEELFILSLSGRLDTLGARELDEVIRQLPETNLHLLLNMENMTFLSSAGIRILIKYYKQYHEKGGDCILTNVPPQATGVLKMVGLEQLVLGGTTQGPGLSPHEYEYDNIKFCCHPLHREFASLFKYEPDNPVGLYDMAIGRNHNQQEMIYLNEQLFHESGTPENVSFEYGIGTHGAPSHFITFTCGNRQPVPLSTLLLEILKICESECAGVVITTQSGQLVGFRNGNNKLLLPQRPVFRSHSLLIAGIAHTDRQVILEPYTRLFTQNGQLAGHFHAAVYPPANEPEEEIDLKKHLRAFQSDVPPEAIFHLINDIRFPEGIGETGLKKGQVWVIKTK